MSLQTDAKLLLLVAYLPASYVLHMLVDVLLDETQLT